MRKVAYIALLLVAASVFYVGNGFSGSDDNLKMAGELWGKIQSDNYQKSWRTYPGKGTMYKGTHPHGAFLSTYVNDSASAALAKKKKELPYGSILIKENYMPDKKLGAITVMERIEGYNPEAGDWFWVKFAPDGKTITMEKDGMTMTLAGKPGGCIGCHSASASGIQFIMTPIK